MKPTDCLRKAQKFLGEEHTSAILGKAAEYREQGMNARAAMVKAAQEQLADVRAEMTAPKMEAAAGKAQAAQEKEPAGSLDEQVAARLAVEQPDLQVVLPGSEERISVADAMKRIAEDQQQDMQWADLVRVAAECALQG